MRNLLALGALGLIVFFGLGWYLGWYKVQSVAGANGHRQVDIDINTNKIKADVNKGESKVHDWLNDRNAQNPQNSTSNPSLPSVTTSFRSSEDGSFVFPSVTITPPSSGPSLPTPR